MEPTWWEHTCKATLARCALRDKRAIVIEPSRLNAAPLDWDRSQAQCYTHFWKLLLLSVPKLLFASAYSLYLSHLIVVIIELVKRCRRLTIWLVARRISRRTPLHSPCLSNIGPDQLLHPRGINFETVDKALPQVRCESEKELGEEQERLFDERPPHFWRTASSCKLASWEKRLKSKF